MSSLMVLMMPNLWVNYWMNHLNKMMVFYLINIRLTETVIIDLE